MRHVMNKKSGKLLCQVKQPKLTENSSIVGLVLGSDNEPICKTCKKHGYDKVLARNSLAFKRWIGIA